jgi:hypothetical protein
MLGHAQRGPCNGRGCPLAGRWEQVTTCREVVDALKDVGLHSIAPAILAGNGLVAGTATSCVAPRAVRGMVLSVR